MKELRQKMRDLYFRMLKMEFGTTEYNAADQAFKEMYKDYKRMYAESIDNNKIKSYGRKTY